MVQEFGLALLVREDNIKQNKSEIDELKYSLLASGNRTLEDLYPEWFLTEPEEVGTTDISNPEFEYDFSEVEWGAPEDISMDELAELQEFLATQKTASTGEGWME